MTTFDEEVFRSYYEYKIKSFIKEELANNLIKNNIFEFDIEKFLMHFPDACEVNDLIIERPKEIEEIILDIFKEAYVELFGEDKELEKIQIAFKNPKGCEKLIEDISSSDINKLVKFEGVIVKAGKVCALLKRACYVCPRCGNIKYKTIHNYFELPKVICNNGDCKEEMVIDYEESTYINIQELEIQQPIDLMKNPDDPPRSIKVFLENSSGIYSGRVDVVGTVLKKKTKPKIPVFEIFVKSNYVKIAESYQKIEVRDILGNEELIETLNELGKKKNIIDILSNFMISQIKGYDLVKKAIFLQQIKGAFKFLPDGSPLRRDSHILLITDPGIGKTTMLRRIARLFPQNAYASVTTATGGGLTANVIREATEIGDGWVVKPGVFVRANEGTACIDELTVDKNVMKYILEAMESQTIHVNKGGINVKLPARCAVLAACNPKRGRFDRNLTVIEQIDIPAPLLSRFDLIFPLMDIPNRKEDEEIAEHILNTHIETATKDYKILGSIDIDGIVVDEKLLKYYIIYARSCAYIEENQDLYLGEFDETKLIMPYLTEKAKKMIKKYYLEMRKLGEGDNPIPITARQLEAIIRIAEMHAKARLSDKVEDVDAEVAINIIDDCLKQVAYDPETGTLDLDKIAGTPKSRRDKMDAVLNIIREIVSLRDDGLAPEEDIYEKAESIGLSEKDVESALEYLKKAGDIYNPRIGLWGLL
ncbi:DNA replication helicase protein MCM [Methanocaldococcus lauensis]|uniref:DNA replication helicase protein MCM n=1 Tax=Methanocaldococcus lauensis TaxID=2546128 RepID=A0A8D6PSZ8_9EURY|nr:minichromosome maintenance protein MCM [Methanocaldococcus lauensis]CAB3287360.1 DNA replication helicase protein MCM [Methanocaldococcus lauensis]